jgi:hypothetical protein
MEDLTTIDNKINDFIYYKPDVAVVLLQQFGYDINLKTATLSSITSKVYNALYIKQDQAFEDALIQAINNEGQNNIAPLVVGIASSVIGSVVSGIFGSDEGAKTRELMKKIALANMSMQEKLATEKILAEKEIARQNILANTLLEYRKTLQLESTQRIKDTWLYVTGLGIGLGILYGVYLVGSKN